jgi:multidrug efflux system membrane fusion protein
MFKNKLQPTHIVFLLISLLLTIWIISGQFKTQPTLSPPPEAMASVAASWSEAQTIERELVVYGDIEPFQIARIKARTTGLVEQIIGKGREVKQGDQLARLSMDDRALRLAQAKAQLASNQRDYQAVQQLIARNLSSESERQLKWAQLEAARAQLRAIEFDIENTRLLAPINGTINRILADLGTLVSPGTDIVEIVDNDPLLAVIHVQQEDIAQLTLNQPARVRFIGGDTREGKIRFISTIGDAKTRTFRVEIALANTDNQLPSGLSAEVTLALSSHQAHLISPALIQLDAEGQVGVFILEQNDKVAFVPISPIRADGQKIWVSGLDQRVRLITLHQAGLRPGQTVRVQPTPDVYLTPVEDRP